MDLLDTILIREDLIQRTVEIEDDLFDRMEKIAPKFNDCSISKIINYSIHDFYKKGLDKIEVGTMNATFKHSVAFRESALVQLSEMSRKYNSYKYVVLNIAIRYGIEKLEKRLINK